MTLEEAGQRVLEGPRYIPCVCEWGNLDCKVCQGWNVVIDPTYVEALKALGIDRTFGRSSRKAMGEAMERRKWVEEYRKGLR